MAKAGINNGIIGIVGGMGPLAGLDLCRKIITQTIAAKDQDHLPLILYSTPQIIGDRTEYLLGTIEENPADVIVQILVKLESMGCTVAGLSCNTVHAPQIFGVIKNKLSEKGSSINLLNIINEVGGFIKKQYPEVTNVGVLGTTGTYRTKLYDQLSDFGLRTINLSPREQVKVHAAIYHPEYGIKSVADMVRKEAREILFSAADSLIKHKSEAIILGCTELPFVFENNFYNGIPAIDPSQILARALIKAHSPRKLKPWV
jgi:aspartate racemase